VSDQDAKREQPLHEVRVGQPLAVGKFHVTRGEFARFVEATGYSAIGGCRALNGSKFEQDGAKSWRDPGFTQTDRDPAVCINWDDAKAYVQWLAQKTGKGYRLLSEAEWEYAARGGTATARWWGDGSADQCKYAHGSNLTSKQKFPGWTTADCGDGYVFTSPVGSFAPNPFGLYDMLGNAWQWVGDCWADNYANAANDASVAPASGGNCGRRAIRGGSWSAIPTVMRVPVRSWNDAGFRSCNLGFRIARTPAT
jgi:formylglycine-generating enzyme required for sulfatase activity